MIHKRNEPIEVQLTGWAYGGEALGRAQDGRMIFAPFCMPGEIVRGTLVEDRDRWARMLPQQWLQTSPGRLEPRCPHFTECGGCQSAIRSLPHNRGSTAIICVIRFYRMDPWV
jgi:tRNA/tmRNA/rRNA uracil-C5-methylase (TrmA/RlmC/RlmD family)